MDVETTINRLREIEDNRFPQKAMEAAIEQREAVTPHLLEALEEVRDNPGPYAQNTDYFLHIAASYLLAQFREERAYPILMEICRLPGKTLDHLYGDTITGGLGRIMASVSGGDPSGLKALIEDPKVDVWVRTSMLGGLMTMMKADMLSRDDIVAYFRELYKGKLERTYEPLWDILIVETVHIHPGDLWEEVQQAIDDDLLDPMMIAPEEIEETRAMTVEEALKERVYTSRHYNLIDDAIAELDWWAWFNPQQTFPVKSTLTPGTVVNTGPDVGRNDPCPCGSGAKYKYCCGKPG
jgi:hypothetical protein